MRSISVYIRSIPLLVVLTGFSIGGCATPGPDKKPLEPIHSVSLSSGTLHISVSSHGCTKKEDFKIDSYKQKQTHVRIERLKHDGCRRRKHLTKLSFPLKDIGVTNDQKIVIDNPIKAFKKPGFTKYKNSSK